VAADGEITEANCGIVKELQILVVVAMTIRLPPAAIKYTYIDFIKNILYNISVIRKEKNIYYIYTIQYV